MNCQELALILDERDLDRLPESERSLAEVHLADCPDCVRDQDLHWRLNALPIPALPRERVARWRTVALSTAGAGSRLRVRSRLVIIGALVAVAAAAALLAVRMDGVPEQTVAAEALPERPSPAPQPAIPAAAIAEAAPVPEVKAAAATPAADLPASSFTVYVMPLVIETKHQVSRTMGEEYYVKLLEQLRAIPGLVLVTRDMPADFRLKVTSGYGNVPERFGGHEQWLQSLVAETRKQGGGDAYTQVLGFSINPDCGRISPADLANASSCTPAGMVELGIQQLRRNVFPADPAASRQLRARFLDTLQPQGVRRQSLADLIEVRQRAPGAMDPELIRVIINDAIANAPYPAQRVNLWRALRGQPADLMVQPLIQGLHRELDDTVRLEMVGTLAAEFSADPAARAELELVARRDVKMLVRKVAERALSGNASWRDYAVATVKDANLPAAERYEPLAWMMDAKVMRPADGSAESDLLAVARKLFDDGEAVALADVLAQASSGPSRAQSGLLQITMSSVQHPAVADFLIATVNRQADFSTFSLLGRHRADPRIEAKLKDIAANHPDPNVRQLAAAQLDTH